MTPKLRYQEYLATNKFQSDPEQEKVVVALDQIFHAITTKRKQFWPVKKNKFVAKGLYLWGSVGIGKTWLMDIFYESLPAAVKMRLHFHRFMREIHQELAILQGKRNPLQLIAKRLAAKTRVLCLDEFLVSDIADAMLLAGLLQALFAEGIILVTTANLAPVDLYKNGLQRQRFLPAIELLQQNTQVIHLMTDKDYRLRTLMQAGLYYTPLNEASDNEIRKRFEELAGTHWQKDEALVIEHRSIPTVRLGTGIVWFNFTDLCSIPRSQMDYLELARSFHTVLLSGVPQIKAREDNLIRYLINLVDIFYDTKTKLIISAAVPIEELYPQGRFSVDFQRTKSRLIEMQSIEYLQMPHGM